VSKVSSLIADFTFNTRIVFMNICPTPNGLPITSNPKSALYLDELTPIAEYMSREINLNLRSKEVRAMKRLNNYPAYYRANKDKMVELLGGWANSRLMEFHVDHLVTYEAKAAAMAIWTKMVAQGQKWDHKPVVRRCFQPRSPGGQDFHAWKDRRYFLDIWSNIHYGYIGIASGFSEAMLLDGAGLEQIGSDFLNGIFFEKKIDIPTGRLRDYDDDNDRFSIELGIKLFSQFPNGITRDQLMENILNSNIGYRQGK
jgi:hypothetical protein